MKQESRRVLFVLGTMDIGGVQSGIMNFAKLLSSDNICFDVIVQENHVGYHEDEFEKYGKVYHVPIPHFKNKIISLIMMYPIDLIWRKKFSSFLRIHEYDVVHSKTLQGVADTLEVAKKYNIPVRVAQCHVDRPEKLNYISDYYYRKCAKRIERSATHKLAVSLGAVDLMFRDYGARVIKNPTISLSRLDPHKYENHPHDSINLIQIGTFSKRKNQIFSIFVLKSLLDSYRDVHLSFVGYALDEPDYYEKLKAFIDEQGLNEYVTFYPKDADVPQLLADSDYMLIPSLREGLPNVALEAQAMGVPCFISDTVNPDTDCGLCTFISLDAGAKEWSEKILMYRHIHGTDKEYIDMSEWDNVSVCQEYLKIWFNR